MKVADLVALTSRPGIRVMEIGFNAGHSAEVFLHNNDTLTLTSFDLGAHPYVATAKKYIDDVYPGRHALVLGDSRSSVPLYRGAAFDVIFIDGGHEYEIARADVENCLRLSHKDTVVILDDTMFTPGWGEMYTRGPTQVWEEMLRGSKIAGLGSKNYCPGYGMSWGKYLARE